MLSIETLHVFDTQYSADSVEWCQKNEKLFTVGTYQLDKDETGNSRKGRIYLFNYDEDIDALSEIQRIETDAILDQKWLDNFLLTATSRGTVQQYQLNKDDQLCKVNETDLNSGDLNSVLALSLDVMGSRILASDSLGRITLLNVEATAPILTQWKAHEFEAWTCAFSHFNEEIVFSGGDDSIFNVWDLRTNNDVLKLKSTTRNAGVTSILNHKEDIVIVGSYDENLKTYDLRNLKSSLGEIDLHGGIWRIKPLNSHPNLLLVACMYHNFSIVDCAQKFKLVGEHFAHESICYGCDWSPKAENISRIFASCSFYDNKLTINRVSKIFEL